MLSRRLWVAADADRWPEGDLARELVRRRATGRRSQGNVSHTRKLLRTFDYTASNWRRVRYQDPELVVTEPASTSATQTAAYLSSSPTPLGISLGDGRKGHLKRAGP